MDKSLKTLRKSPEEDGREKLWALARQVVAAIIEIA
jgi:hypothetical protein